MATAINFQTNRITSPVWLGDYGSRDHLLPGAIKLDAAQFLAEDGTTAVVDTAGAEANATSIPLKAALANAIPNGTTLRFGTKKFATLTAAAAAGATSLTVEALPTALVDGDTATYAGSGTKKKLVKSGTYVGRTFSERDSGTAFGPAASGDQERFLVAFDNFDIDADPTVTVVRRDSLVKENFLPDWTAISANATVLGYLRTDYETTKGVA